MVDLTLIELNKLFQKLVYGNFLGLTYPFWYLVFQNKLIIWFFMPFWGNL